MNQTEKLDFFKHIAGISKHFRYTADEFDMNLYWQMLKKYDYQVVKAAIYRYLEIGKFMPKVADLIAIINENEEPVEDKALFGWSEVIHQIKRVGPYQSPHFSDPIIPYVIQDLGGWKSLCMINESEMQWVEKNFERKYVSYSKFRPEGIEHRQLRIEGIAEQHNKRLGNGSMQKLMDGVNAHEIMQNLSKNMTKEKIEEESMPANDEEEPKQSNLPMDLSKAIGL